MGTVGKHLKSFESFIKKGMITEIGDTVTDDEFGTLWTSITIDGEQISNVNCGQLLANKLIVAHTNQEYVELSFVKYNNGADDFNSIAALKSSMGIITDIEFSVEQLRLGAAKMQRTAKIGFGIAALLIVTVFIAVIGLVILAGSVALFYRAKRPLRFAEELEKASRALN